MICLAPPYPVDIPTLVVSDEVAFTLLELGLDSRVEAGALVLWVFVGVGIVVVGSGHFGGRARGEFVAVEFEGDFDFDVRGKRAVVVRIGA